MAVKRKTRAYAFKILRQLSSNSMPPPLMLRNATGRLRHRVAAERDQGDPQT